MTVWPVLCDGAELAVECANGARELGLRIEPRLGDANRFWDEAKATVQSEPRLAVAAASPPTLAALVELAHAARGAGSPAAVALPCPSPAAEAIRAVSGDLGLVAVGEVRPLLAVLALAGAGADRPWEASIKGLPPLDRIRLKPAIRTGTAGGAFGPGEAGILEWRPAAGVPGVAVGEARDVAAAVAALRRTARPAPDMRSSVDGVDPQRVADVLFGPARALSDPASKAALQPYGLPMPTEELCASASRAAAESTRMGYPVRIALASPDLRVWDHPELSVEMVDNAARVRDVFRSLTALGRQYTHDARLLGVTVSPTTVTQALLGVEASPLPRARVATRIGFADPHGAASGDTTLLVLPAATTAIERALARLRGAPLVLPGGDGMRKANVESISDALLRLSAFINEQRAEVERVELRPLALLPDGTCEVREACVTVSDAFERRMQQLP